MDMSDASTADEQVGVSLAIGNDFGGCVELENEFLLFLFSFSFIQAFSAAPASLTTDASAVAAEAAAVSSDSQGSNGRMADGHYRIPRGPGESYYPQHDYRPGYVCYACRLWDISHEDRPLPSYGAGVSEGGAANFGAASTAVYPLGPVPPIAPSGRSFPPGSGIDTPVSIGNGQFVVVSPVAGGIASAVARVAAGRGPVTINHADTTREFLLSLMSR